MVVTRAQCIRHPPSYLLDVLVITRQLRSLDPVRSACAAGHAQSPVTTTITDSERAPAQRSALSRSLTLVALNYDERWR